MHLERSPVIYSTVSHEIYSSVTKRKKKYLANLYKHQAHHPPKSGNSSFGRSLVSNFGPIHTPNNIIIRITNRLGFPLLCFRDQPQRKELAHRSSHTSWCSLLTAIAFQVREGQVSLANGKRSETMFIGEWVLPQDKVWTRMGCLKFWRNWDSVFY